MGLLGAHVSITGGLACAPERGKALGCETIQIFSKNQRQWIAKALTNPEIHAYRQAIHDTQMGPVLVHDAYLINLGHPEAVKRTRSQEAFLEEMVRAEQLGCQFLVFHPGSHLNQTSEAYCLSLVADSLNRLHEKTPGYQLTVLMETTAGQGTNVGYRFEHLAEILRQLHQPERVGVCIDTCHIFAAGYDIRTSAGWEATFQEFERQVGLEKIRAFHVNDSKKGLGSRVDRHEAIGKGEIGLEAFRYLVNDPRFKALPMVLETPGDEVDYQANLALLRSLQIPAASRK